MERRERIEALLGTGTLRRRYETDPTVRAVVTTAANLCWSRERMLEVMAECLADERDRYSRVARELLAAAPVPMVVNLGRTDG